MFPQEDNTVAEMTNVPVTQRDLNKFSSMQFIGEKEFRNHLV